MIYEADDVTLFLGDCREVMRKLEPESVDAIVTDPPYGLEFMGKEWDKLLAKDRHVAYPSCRGNHGPNAYRAGLEAQEWHESWAVEALRVLKPGGHMVAFGGTRTFHRLACAVEDAGFEIRDCLMWLYGQGFPKSHDVSKAIDKRGGANIGWFGPWLREERKKRGITQKNVAQHFLSKTGGLTGCVANWELGLNLPTISEFNKLCDILQLPFTRLEEAEREVTGHDKPRSKETWFTSKDTWDITAPATDAARQWQGWGTALKPSWESVLLARKPFTIDREQAIIVESLTRLEAQLWSLLPVNIAAESFGLSPSEFDEVCDFAQWPADERASIQADLLARMDMSQFVSVVTSCLNTVMSWSSTLAELLNPASMSTTGTATKPTTDWRTLSSCVSVLMPRTIIEVEIEAPGSQCDALPVGRYLNVVAASNANTHELSALAAAISNGQARCQAETAQAFRPNYEPILLCRKPLSEKTVVANVQKYDTGALNVDGCRIGSDVVGARASNVDGITRRNMAFGMREFEGNPASGRWPANLCLECTCEEMRERRVKAAGNFPAERTPNEIYGSGKGTSLKQLGGARSSGDPDGKETVRIHTDPNCPCAMLDAQSGERAAGAYPAHRNTSGYSGGLDQGVTPHGFIPLTDSGGASRFFYTSKAGPDERGGGKHPTVKPRDLMLWLCRLITPPGGLILDPFIGSGTTAVAARMGGFRCVGIDNNEEYLSHAAERLRLGDEGLTQVVEARRAGAEQARMWDA